MFGQADEFYKFIVMVSFIKFSYFTLLEKNQFLCMLYCFFRTNFLLCYFEGMTHTIKHFHIKDVS